MDPKTAGRKGGRLKGTPNTKTYKRLSEEEWLLVRYAVLRERATLVSAAAAYGVSERTISNRKRLEAWDAVDPFKTYVGLPTDEEILEMRSRHLVKKAMKALNDKLGQAAKDKSVSAQDVAALARAAGALETKLRRRAPSGTGAGVDSVRAGRKAPSVDDTITILNARAARRRIGGADQDADGK